MVEFERLKDKEAEIFIRTNEEVIKLKLPSSLVEELEDLRTAMKADDLLEVLIRSAKGMVSIVGDLKIGEYEYNDSGKKCKIKKTKN
ncbi:MAG: hypothetical protein QT05_C0038G0008 [archaeon GW2011_AR13]|nr:MAG: hypothetical protein QT05_C0038G0008 [archaeon GW2011_AR13]HIG94776.1 hypothetical protein [Nanoarchaeota archaeon]HIH63742.1 hypothetical protein [Nanoarchaeota archaeon]HIJ09615.1 hypothetical protein [Nanoarchaeota archaeon]